MSAENLSSDFLYKVNTANLMLLSGRSRGPVDAIFFHDRSFGDFTNLFEIAGTMYKSETATFIATPNTDGARLGRNIPGEASPGKDWTVRQLLKQEVPVESILHPDTPSHHTREENTSFLELSMRMSWKSGIILTQPHQLLRAMLGMVQVMNEAQYLMKIYTATPTSIPWYEVTHVHQGLEEKPRIQNIVDELQRVYEYQQKGDLATFEELFTYLEARDRGSQRFNRNFPPQLQGGLPA